MTLQVRMLTFEEFERESRDGLLFSSEDRFDSVKLNGEEVARVVHDKVFFTPGCVLSDEQRQEIFKWAAEAEELTPEQEEKLANLLEPLFSQLRPPSRSKVRSRCSRGPLKKPSLGV